jgi:multisubunit Na+/H+ antiporter MnhB subunit
MMSGSLLVFDAVLALALVAIATGVLLVRNLFQAIVLFIVFGLLLAVAWCRLEAVDVALAEAAMGAGLTGAMLLNTWLPTHGQPGTRSPDSADRKESSVARSPFMPVPPRLWSRTAFLSIGLTILVACGFAAVVVPLAVSTEAPRIAMDEALPRSGVPNPVTAVLLNFRAYDTLLEVVVLLSAVLAVIPLTAPAAGLRRASPAGPVLESFTRLMVPVTSLVAASVLWAGTKAPGGAFQAAAILGAAGVLLLVSGARPPKGMRLRGRVLLSGGLAFFLVVGLAGMPGGGRFLQYHAGWAGVLIVLIETALTVSLAIILIRLFSGTAPSESWSAGDSDSGGAAAVDAEKQ